MLMVGNCLYYFVNVLEEMKTNCSMFDVVEEAVGVLRGSGAKGTDTNMV